MFALILSQTLYASDYYWINGAGQWNDPSHWSLSSGGSPAGSIPGSGDNVFFDNNSIGVQFASVELTTNVTVASITVTSNKVPAINGGDVILTIQKGLNLEKRAFFDIDGKIRLAATDGLTHTIKTSDVRFKSDIEFAEGKWNLDGHLITWYEHSIKFLQGEFYSNNYSIATNELIANDASVSLDLGTSYVLGVEKVILPSAINTGGNDATFVNNIAGAPYMDLGEFGSSMMMDESVICPNPPFALDLLIISDYNGKDISCADTCDGILKIIPYGTVGPFSISFEGGDFDTVTIFDSLCNETYDFVVIDSSQELIPGVFAQCSISEGLVEPGAMSIGAPIPIAPTCPDSCDGAAFTFPSGGTPTYTLFWPSSGESTSNPVGLCAGWNVVEMTDVNGCIQIDSVEIPAVPQILPDFTITPPTCFGDCDAEIDINPSGGNGGPYTIQWSPDPASGPGTDPGIGFCSGVVNITVFDTDGCPKDTSATIIDPPAVVVSVPTTTDALCFGACDGTATASAVGGTGGYTFEWFDATTDVSVGVGSPITTLCAGDYYVVATDASGCTDTSADFTITEPPALVLNQDAYSVSCPGFCDGSVDVDAAGGTPPYTYAWTTFPGLVGIGAADSINGLCAGFYQITVTDNNGCDSTMIEIEVIEPPALTLTITGTDPTCYDLCDGSAIAVVGGGTPGYSYSWSPVPPVGGGSDTPSSMCAGDYDLTVTDSEGCTILETVTLTNPPVYDVDTSYSDITCNGGADGTATVTVNAGGSGVGYTFDWSPGSPTGDGTASVSGLTAGVWCVLITDDQGCDTTICFTIDEPPVLTVSASVISHVTCAGDCNGSATAAIAGGVPPYTIVWDDPASTATAAVSGLCGGTFTITVTDANGCIQTDNVTITEPAPFDLTTAQTDNLCFGDCLGTATVTMNSGGTPPYTILWDDPAGQTSFTATALCAGAYTATVTDANGCDTIIPFTIIEPAEIVIDTNLIKNTCFGDCDGELYITFVGGTPGYTIEWFDAATALPLGVNNDSISGLCPGDYYAEVTDANGCVGVSETMTILELPEIVTSIISQTDATCTLCDGTAEVLATGGAGGFTYDWTPDPITGDGTTTVTGLCDGVYNILITDAAGCTETMSVTINSAATEILALDSVDVLCFGDCNGEINSTWGEILAPYTLEVFFEPTGLSAAGPITPATSTENVGGLCADTYIVVLTNSAGCVTSDTITINEPSQITATVTGTDVSCAGGCDGSAVVASAGGTGAHTYNWVPLPGSGQGTTNAGGLCAGTWDVEVTDENGCTEIFSVIIDEPSPITITLETSTDITCFGDNDGTASVAASGGTAPLSFNWIDCATMLPIGQTTSTATGLGPGDYACEITDANGCIVTSVCLPVVEPTEITAIVNIQSVSCFGDCDGLLDVVAAGGTGPYFYQWEDEFNAPLAGQTDDTLQNMCAGIFYVTVTDQNGCSETFGPFDLVQPNPWDVTEFQTNITCSGTCDGVAGVIVNAGNNPPYTYLWDDPLVQTTATASNLCAGTWNITISDAGTCDTTVTFTILDNNPVITNAIQTDVACFGDCTGEITVAPTGGTPPYTVTWSDLQVGNTATGLCAGSITVTITDGNGCVKDSTFTITEPTEMTSASTFSNPSTCLICNGSATVNITGGTPGYTYDWDPDPSGGDGSNFASGLCPGVVTCTITDANGCTLIETFAISDIDAEDITMSSTDVSCFGECDGTAEVTYICSDPVCTNQWYEGVGGTPIAGETATTIIDLCAGTYFVEVTNASLCVAVDSVTISSPPQIMPNETITPIVCNGDANGAIDLVPSGGTGAGYTYVWTPAPPVGDGTANVSGLSAGTWCVDISDSDGCTESWCFDLLDPTPIVITPSGSDVSCNGLCDGIISVTVSGGGGGFTYQWLDGAGSPIVGETGTIITGLCAGNYSLDVTDANGCTVNSGIITISEPIAITGPVTGTDITCFGDCDGTVTVTPGGGTPAYTIQWYDSGGLIGATTTTVTDLCPEDYYAVIGDANGCIFTTATISIIEPAELTATVVANDASCFGVCDGDAEVFPVGGTPAYIYEWLTIGGGAVVGGTNAAVPNLCAGGYTVEVTDQNGCSTGLIPVTINENPEITGDVFTNDANCGFADGSATVFAAGGTPGFTYQWLDDLLNPIAGETSNILAGVTSGTYYCEVTDAAGCTETFIANISDVGTTTLTWDAVNDPSCFGAADGSIDITVTGLNPPFSYTWNPGGLVAEDPTGLVADDYTLQITDDLGCISFYDTTLVEPAEILVSVLTVTPSDCDLCNGAIDITTSGGTGVLSSVWNNGDTGNSISSLCPGVYEVQVTDDNGCMVSEPVTIDNNAGLTADFIITAITCADACDGSVTVSGIGGTPPYTYSWFHNGSTSTTESGLCGGTYFCEVTDAVGCTYAVEVEMTEPDAIVVDANMNNPTCGASDGSITVLTSGGVLPHTYLWNTADVTPSISGLSGGVYTLTVTDATGCSQDFVYGLSNADAPVAELTGTDVSCNGACDGTLDTLSQTGGTPAFTYQWMDSAGSPIAGETTPAYGSVCAGDYTLEITDGAGCVSYQSYTITEPDSITLNPLFDINPSCFGDCDGQLIANAIGGTFAFTYSWDDPATQTTSAATGLCDGTYTVTITDANGCSKTQTGTIVEPSEIIITVDSTVSATCSNSTDGEIYVTVSGGMSPYTYEYVSETGTDTLTTEDPTGLSPMNWILTVTDANGCTSTDTILVDTLLSVIAYAGLDTLYCFGDSLYLIGSSNIPSGADYTWMDTLGNILSDTTIYGAIAGTPGAGVYVLQVDYSGCTHTDTVVITTGDSIYVEAGPDIEIYPNQTDNIGGSPTSVFDGDTISWTPITYLDDPSSDNPNIIEPQESGWYYVNMVDSNGCRAIDSMYVEVLPDIIIPDGISPNGDGLNETWILDFLDNYPDTHVEINVYNRWGEVLYSADETYADDWGGTYEKKGKKHRLPAGTYYYTIFIDHEDFPDPFTGPITIMW